MEGRGREKGQALVEFAFVLGVVLLLLLGCAQIGLYALTRGTAVGAAERGVYVAAGAIGTSSGAPATSAVYASVREQLQSGLVGATARQMPAAGTTCPALSSSWPVGVVYVCSAADPTHGTVEVAVRGWVSAMVPPGFGLGSWRTGALAIDVDDVVHTAVFAP